MKTLNQKSILGMAMLALTLSACGSNSSRTTDGSSTNNQTTATPTPASQGNIYNLPVAPDDQAIVTGSTGPSSIYAFRSTVQTSRLLRVKITAGQAETATYGNRTVRHLYGCLRVTVKVNGVARTTMNLRVPEMQQNTNSQCVNNPTSQILDFSSFMTGAGSAVITVDSAHYDQDLNSWDVGAYGTAMVPVHSTHRATFNIQVQSDGTYME